MKFNELNLHENVLAGIEKAGFTECMAVQEKALPVSLTGKDIMVQSKTGSGKTAVFVITFLEEFLRKKEKGIASSCLIIAPTRELAQQIADDAQVLCSGIPGFHIGCFTGGTGYERQKKLLAMGCDMYVGTPGRILDFMGSKELRTQTIDTFVIDEADRLFDMGFYPDLKKIFRHLGPREKRQTMLFSATLEMRVRELAWEYMNSPAEIDFEYKTITVESIKQELYHVAKSEKLKLLLQLLAVEKPESALIFTNSRYMTMHLAKLLKANGWNADYISGDLSQYAREKALEKMKSGKTAILVATDVAARGLQIDGLPLVVNYDVPEDYENYVHRIGRTARAGRSGKAITLADEEFVYGLEAIEKYINMKIPVIWPDNLPEIEVNTVIKTQPRPQAKQAQKPSQKPAPKQAQKPSQKQAPKQKPGQAPKPAPEQAQRPSQKPAPKQGPKPSHLGNMTQEQRMAYYKKKYGFEPSEHKEAPKVPEKKKSFWNRVASIFKSGKGK